MIVPLHIEKENPLLQLFSQVDRLFEKIEKEQPTKRKGCPFLYTDAQIVKCLVYQSSERIVSFWELEWRLLHDPIARHLIGFSSVPDYSTLCLRA